MKFEKDQIVVLNYDIKVQLDYGIPPNTYRKGKRFRFIRHIDDTHSEIRLDEYNVHKIETAALSPVSD